MGILLQHTPSLLKGDYSLREYLGVYRGDCRAPPGFGRPYALGNWIAGLKRRVWVDGGLRCG